MDVATLVIRSDARDIEHGSRALSDLTRIGSATENSLARMASNIDASFSRATSVIKSFAAAYSGMKLLEFSKEVTLMAAHYNTLGVVMNTVGKNAGYSTVQLQQTESALRQTGISALESRQNIARMIQANVDLSQSTQLARIAQDAAVIGNLNSSESYTRLVYGIQSAQTEILRTIGINVNFEAGYRKLAAQLGKTADALSETEKIQARINEVMEKGKMIAGAYEASMGEAGKQLNSMKRYIDDLKASAGQAFMEPFTRGVTKATDALKFLSENSETVGKTLTWALGGATLLAISKTSGALGQLVADTSKQGVAARVTAAAALESARAEAVNAAAALRSAQASAVLGGSQTALSAAKARNTVATNALTVATSNYARAATMAGIAARGASAALAAVGGPFGVFIAAAAVVAYNWDKIAEAAGDAAAISENAARRIAAAMSEGAKAPLATLQTEIALAKKGMAEADEELRKGTKKIFDGTAYYTVPLSRDELNAIKVRSDAYRDNLLAAEKVYGIAMPRSMAEGLKGATFDIRIEDQKKFIRDNLRLLSDSAAVSKMKAGAREELVAGVAAAKAKIKALEDEQKNAATGETSLSRIAQLKGSYTPAAEKIRADIREIEKAAAEGVISQEEAAKLLAQANEKLNSALRGGNGGRGPGGGGERLANIRADITSLRAYHDSLTQLGDAAQKLTEGEKQLNRLLAQRQRLASGEDGPAKGQGQRAQSILLLDREIALIKEKIRLEKSTKGLEVLYTDLAETTSGIRATETYIQRLDTLGLRVHRLTDAEKKLLEVKAEREALIKQPVPTDPDELRSRNERIWRFDQRIEARQGLVDIENMASARKALAEAKEELERYNATMFMSQEAKERYLYFLDKEREVVATLPGEYAELITAYDESRAKAREFTTGWNQALAQYAENVGNQAAQGQRAFETATTSMTDTLTKFFMSGKLGWQDFANSVIEQIIRIQVQQATLSMVQGGFSLDWLPSGLFGPSVIGSAKGNLFYNGQVVRAFASGGAFANSVASSPTLAPMALFGEAGPEAIMPLARDGAGRLGVKAQGAGTEVNLALNVINQSSQPVSASASQPRFDGRQMVVDIVLTDLRRGGPVSQGIKAIVGK
ncbi:phage tail tape measure C-terminal domain-containing protein [Chromobacterium sp.]|uniref:phage tail tape measure C-terminal domain-containing protein n=1 Tax=Chromobacterium sp. TaxID=306190 RepID=UPI0035AEC8CC